MMLRNKNGFTYLDIVVSFAIFGLFLVILLRLGNTVYQVTKVSEITNQMIHIAEFEMENYKSRTTDISEFVNNTDFILISETTDSDGNVSQLELTNGNVDRKFSVQIRETILRTNISEVTILVTSENIDASEVKLVSSILWDSVEP